MRSVFADTVAQRRDDGLSPAQGRLVRAARQALARTIEAGAANPQEAMTLICVTYAGAFLDILSASSGAADLIALANMQLRSAGYRIEPLPRN